MNYDYRVLWRLVKDDSNLESIRDCLSSGVDPNSIKSSGFCGRRFTSPLQIAANSSNNNPGAVMELIKFGADLNFQDSAGYTALHYAVRRKKLDVLNVLIESGTSINNNSCRETAQHKAVDSEKDDLTDVRNLPFQQSINLDAQNKIGNTPLMYAVTDDFSEAVDILLHKGANPNIVNRDMESPLHQSLATEETNYKIVAALVSKGADIYWEDENRQTPIDLLILNLRYNECISATKYCLKAIVLRYEINDALTRKIEAVSQLQPYFRSCCEEKERMKESFISEYVSIHDFIFGNFKKNDFRAPLMELYKPLVEWLVQGFCLEYFSDLFDRISTNNLVLLLDITRGQIKDVYREEGTFNNMLSKIIIKNLTKFLSRSDIFYLIVAVSNVKISESLEILYERRITFL